MDFNNKQAIWIAYCVQARKKQITNAIYRFGNFLQDQLQFLMTIKRVSPFLALAFLADVADIKRFKKQQMHPCLGAVPGVKSSGSKIYLGHITRQGVGRSRIACIRKTFGIMRKILLANKEYRYINKKLFDNKLRTYRKEMEKIIGEQKSSGHGSQISKI
ncbi:MAG: transposase [Spirochaeta sp.]|nr:transposase [Spirochaeta sp.]